MENKISRLVGHTVNKFEINRDPITGVSDRMRLFNESQTFCQKNPAEKCKIIKRKGKIMVICEIQSISSVRVDFPMR